MKKARVLAPVAAALCVVVDQIIKLWARGALPGRGMEIIPGLFSLTYVENRGAAFGILQGNTLILSVVTGAVMLLGIAAVYSKKIQEPFLAYTIMLIVAGGGGNWVDRVFRGYVVDYLDFSALFSFPVFNLADCFVVCGTFLLLFYVLRAEKEKERRGGSAGER